MSNDNLSSSLFKDFILVAIITHIIGEFWTDVLFTIIACALIMVFGGLYWLQDNDINESIVFGGILATVYTLIPVIVVGFRHLKHR